jgi:hypothetical protein
MTQNILRVELLWPTFHKDAKEFCHTCDVYQRVGKPSIRDNMHLVPHVMLEYLDKWVFYFIGPINPPTKSLGARYIITATNYLI